MTNKKQTPVQWLREQLATAQSAEVTEWLWTKALEIEREQIEMAYKADLYPCSDEDAKQYFTDTYQSEP